MLQWMTVGKKKWLSYSFVVGDVNPAGVYRLGFLFILKKKKYEVS